MVKGNVTRTRRQWIWKARRCFNRSFPARLGAAPRGTACRQTGALRWKGSGAIFRAREMRAISQGERGRPLLRCVRKHAQTGKIFFHPSGWERRSKKARPASGKFRERAGSKARGAGWSAGSLRVGLADVHNVTRWRGRYRCGGLPPVLFRPISGPRRAFGVGGGQINHEQKDCVEVNLLHRVQGLVQE